MLGDRHAVCHITNLHNPSWTTTSPGKSVEDEGGVEGGYEGLQKTHPNAESWPVVIQAQRQQTARKQQSVGTNSLSICLLVNDHEAIDPFAVAVSHNFLAHRVQSIGSC